MHGTYKGLEVIGSSSHGSDFKYLRKNGRQSAATIFEWKEWIEKEAVDIFVRDEGQTGNDRSHL